MPNLKNKVAVITGASSGIGAATAVIFAELGCCLTITGRKENALEETRQKCLSAGLRETQVLVLNVEMEKEDGLKKIVESTLSAHGKIDILVNNAGMGMSGKETDPTHIDLFDRLLAVNTRCVVLLTRLALPHITATKGSIVNVSSINGICSFPKVTYYCMSKAALDQFTKCLALEVADKGVRVNSVNPGVIKTKNMINVGLPEEEYEQFLEHSKTTHALGRVGEAEEVGRAIAFLASDDASFTTGMLFRIDGGRGLMAPR